MRAAIYRGPGDIAVEEVPKPEIREPTDAIVRVTHTAICGSDLRFYRGESDREKGSRVGHEPMGHRRGGRRRRAVGRARRPRVRVVRDEPGRVATERNGAKSVPRRSYCWQYQNPTPSASFVRSMDSRASAAPVTARMASTFSGTTSDSWWMA